MGGRIVGVVAIEPVERNYTRIQELHSTKGWRHPVVVHNRCFSSAPVFGRYYRSGGSKGFVGTSDAGRLIRGRSFMGCTTDLMRHSWYRRELLAPTLSEAENTLYRELKEARHADVP